jgi:capsular exopolysaccharide synthesis family protein
LQEQSGATDTLLAPDDSAVEESPRPPERAPATKIAANGSFGTLAIAAADHKARLLPHTADSRIAERYRLLRTQILQEQARRMFHTVLITSPGPGEGKTVTLLNLGLIFAMLPSCQVLVVDGDLRRGTMGKWLGIAPDHVGLSDFIEGSVPLEEAVLKSPAIPIRFMVRGNSKLAPAELLHSPRLQSGLQEMAARFDLVLVDSPPVNLLTDAQLLASACDVVVMVARAFSTSQKELEEATQKLRPFRLIGCVLNGSPPASPYYQYDYYRSRESR